MSHERMRVTRRKFLATSAAGLAAAGLGAFPGGKALAAGEDTKAAPKDLPIRTLGRTGMKVPVISQGVGGCQDPSMVVAAYEGGIRHFDTAAGYAFGANEQMLGDVIRRLQIRDRVNIATKLFQPAQRRPGNRRNRSGRSC